MVCLFTLLAFMFVTILLLLINVQHLFQIFDLVTPNNQAQVKNINNFQSKIMSSVTRCSEGRQNSKLKLLITISVHLQHFDLADKFQKDNFPPGHKSSSKTSRWWIVVHFPERNLENYPLERAHFIQGPNCGWSRPFYRGWWWGNPLLVNYLTLMSGFVEICRPEMH